MTRLRTVLNSVLHDLVRHAVAGIDESINEGISAVKVRGAASPSLNPPAPTPTAPWERRRSSCRYRPTE